MKRAAEREGKLNPMSFRATPELRAKLEAAASKAGRSLTQEVEHRLEQSFISDRLDRIEERLDQFEDDFLRHLNIEAKMRLDAAFADFK